MSKLVLTGIFVAIMLPSHTSFAEVSFATTTTYFDEGGGPLEMNVINPSAKIRGTIKDRVSLNAGWEADVVSGASVAVVDNPGGEVDVITSATQLNDVRNVVSAGIGVSSDFATISASYSYGTESDYRSHGFSISGVAELNDRNTAFAVSYAQGFDSVCTLSQPRAQEAVDRQRLPNSDGCFESEDRETQKLRLHAIEGSWTQTWAPVFVTQLTLSTQILNGFQSNAYRAVWLGRSAAQEHHPENRARFAVGARARLFLKPLKGAFQLYTRLYRDTWDISSVTAELAYEQNFGKGIRLRVRGRYYVQSGAAFFSDDYVRFPQGQYFTGDRELSPMNNLTLGARIVWDIPSNDEGKVGFLSGLKLVLKFDFNKYRFTEFNYGNAAVPNNKSFMATIGLNADF